MKLDLKRMIGLGLVTLIFSMLPSVFLLMTFPKAPDPSFLTSLNQSPIEVHCPRLDLKLALSNDFSALSIGNAKEQISFSVDPPRPDSKVKGSRLMIRLTQSKQIKRVELPAKLDFEFSSGILQFSDRSSRFWLNCSALSADEISAILFYETPEGEKVVSANWTSPLQETPIQSIEEFPEGSPFRELGEARVWGHDLFIEKYAGGETIHRLEVGPASKADLMDCSLKDWLVFKEKRWQKISTSSEVEGLPVAHLKSTSPQSVEIEGWEGTSHMRIKLPFAALAPLKMRGEELFTQLRVRSEKQVSCMFDKQCLILRPNDWVLKTQGKWRLLRKKEEKAAFLEGKLSGEIFVLDRIEAKAATKSIMGHYFSAGRSQVVPIEYVQKPSLQKGTGKKR